MNEILSRTLDRVVIRIVLGFGHDFIHEAERHESEILQREPRLLSSKRDQRRRSFSSVRLF